MQVNFNISILFFLLLSLSLHSCDYKAEQLQLKSYLTFKIIDSIRLESNPDLVKVRAISDTYYAGKNLIGDKLIVFDQKGKKIKTIQDIGEGPMEYKDIKNYGFTDLGGLTIFDGEKIISYSDKFENKIVCHIQPGSFLAEPNDSRLFSDIHGSFYISSTSPGDPNELQYFNTTHLFSKITKDCQMEHFGNYPIESIFRKKIHVAGYDSRIYILSQESLIFQAFRWNELIHIWDLNSRSIKESLNIKLDNFGEIYYNKNNSLENKIYSIQRNPRIIDLLVNSDFILIYYKTGMPHEHISTQIETYNQNAEKYTKKYLSVRDRKGKQLGKDFTVDKLDHLIGFDNNGYLIFQGVSKDESIEIYRASLMTSKSF